MKTSNDFKNQSVSELHRLLAVTRAEVRALRARVSERQLGQVHLVAVAKKKVAQILTAIQAAKHSRTV